MKKMLSALLASIATLACSGAWAEVSPGAPPDAAAAPYGTGSQMQSTFQYWGSGLGPQALGVASQRSFVTLYGTLDLGVNYTKDGPYSITRVQSGGALTSKFGFYGQEYLGNQWTVFFRLESGFMGNTGSVQDSTSLFNRASYVGMQNPIYGQFTLGRQYTSAGVAALGADPFLAVAHESVYTYLFGTSDLGLGANSDALGRLPNTLRYISPRFGPIGLDLSYSLKGDQTFGPAVHQRSAMISYVDKRAVLSVAFGQSWCDLSMSGSCVGDTAIAPTKRTDSYLASLRYDVGPFIAQGAYIRYVPKATDSAIASLYLLGLQKWWGSNLLRASVAYRDTTKSQDYAYGSTIGIDHFLSKRTSLYGRAGVVRNGPNSSVAYNYDSGSPALAPGRTVSSVTLGINHQF
ncbi:porin [Burkholderia vietnamiensis]|uniref:Porin n=1 Tax=Burkholderia vietnamiensis TaxID=60552 RepID=A0AAW7SZD4_BURVI|nr:porin [Burkholderia vietnamiensis]MBH9645881.1 porin [Burkholderia vietnamiensis]MBR8008810.1 porin [Burkholderia vietnamiensis]MDN7551334.1 porin [Burkholderia vietnamiensis]MDN7795148.1 porin [Burkholderia vietnamiensis]MDN8073715.1 porin [Burkholderia vietnamiensis]